MTQYAFYFDASACSGCKACQVACKDRHGLPPGVVWRRVYEVEGGGWTRRGAAWQHDVFAYHLSVACNHCERPICLEVCPTRAITRRDDGLVLLGPDRCMGCRYCAWACPYGAPQWDAEAGRMTKCNFCVEDVDRGGMPACVAACPMRVLDFGDRTELEARHGPLPEAYPLPDARVTRPALAMTAPRDAGRAAAWLTARERGPDALSAPAGDRPGSPDADAGPRVANREEVRPR